MRRRRAIERFDLDVDVREGDGEEESVGGANGHGIWRENADAGAEGREGRTWRRSRDTTDRVGVRVGASKFGTLLAARLRSSS